MLEKIECKSNIIPLPLILCSRQPGSELVGKLFGVLVLRFVSMMTTFELSCTKTYLLNEASEELDDPLESIDI
jgi:hypothetical protein